jgi:hypothetical protein
VSIDEELIRITHAALDECTEAQRTAYRLVHGINEDGEPTNAMPVRAAARQLGRDQANVSHSLSAAESIVLARCCRYLRDRLADMVDDTPTIIEAVGTSTWDDGDARIGYVYHRHDATERTIHLGAGSEAAISAGKHQRDGAFQQIHQRYADGGSHA